jgi:hypothetical protein
MTYVTAIKNAIQGNLTDEVIERLTALQTTLEKKAGAERKPTARQEANANLRTTLVEFINENAMDDGFTVTDLLKQCPAVEGDSNQHVSALLRQAVAKKEISKGTVKRRTYFAPVGVYPFAEEEEA